MSKTEIVMGIILMVLAVAVSILVLMQSGKEKSLSGTIAGAGESFFSKNKGKTKERTLSIVTTVLSIIFAVLAVVFVIIVLKGETY
ncbi:MAG: preprotein translocase subunit SecG [Clostridia bacterium]|nr:preprotein translocase subunit SecG [Clostridia bacterium]